ncbi:MAG: Stk1 family PASTA domain-containing Ser/Thr kinase [Epulopiscium sp.]|nr:Stk1 family PASTA domain-containing Ser/Thr kinase [Candidatus Epulonipiscium sp.]
MILQSGTILGNRYEIIEKIGAGGMSIVYKARCNKLQRYVAIKILREEFITDEEFVKRFRIEAQAAASLSHPNIVNVYDVGNEKDIYYIVMEYIQGKTLKQWIQEKGILSSKEILNIAIPIANALNHAHKHHIIHRDIKPQNILVTDEGMVKVTDFGIARATTNSTVTAMGNAIGSVHYFSPEQARGGYVDEKSDIYSLGITMYEMATNTLPFQADSPVSVALQHINEDLPKPSTINENLAKSLEGIIIKATQKRPELRYQTVEELLKDMKKALLNPDENFVLLPDIENSPTVQISEEEMMKIKSHSHTSKQAKSTYRLKEDEKYDEEGEWIEKKKERWVVAGAIFTSMIIIAIISFFGWNSLKEYTKPKHAEVPNLMNKTYEEAQKIAEERGLLLEKVGEQYNDTIALGHIVSQQPEKDVIIGIGSTIEVEISKGEQLFEVPNVLDLEYTEGEQKVEHANLVPEVESVYNESVPLGIIFDQQPASGTKLKREEKVILFASLGKEEKIVIVPDVRNESEAEAKKKLEGNKLTVGTVTPIESAEVEKGHIISQTVSPGQEVKEGYVVDLVVSTGKKEEKPKTVSITIPNIFPNDQEEGTIIVIMENQDLRMKIYESKHKKEEMPLTIPIQGIGRAKIEILLDGTLKSEGEIHFDEVS